MSVFYKWLNAIGLAFLLMTGAMAFADEAVPDKVHYCVACHGALGVSEYGIWPNIAGQKQLYLANQLKDFRDGKRNNPWMSPIAWPLSDKEIEELAEFFSRL